MSLAKVDALKKLLEEDVSALVSILDRPGPLPPAHVRVAASAVARRWLIDGQLSRLANGINAALTLPTLDTSEIVTAAAKDGTIRFFLAGGVMMDGEPIRGYYVADSPFEGKPPMPIDTMRYTWLTPAKFLRMNRVLYGSTWFNAEQVLRFVANKYGGVHFDDSRDQPWHEELERAAAFFTIGNPDGLNERRLIETRTPLHSIRLVLPKEVGHLWTCLDIELLAVAQSLTNIRCNDQPLLEWAAPPEAKPIPRGWNMFKWILGPFR